MEDYGIKELAKFVQGKIHDDHLPGFYFSEDDVEEIIQEYFESNNTIRLVHKDDLQNE